MPEFDVIVIGGGVVGLATAATVSKKYKNVLLLDKNKFIAMETSSRNSEVVHAGLYYSGMPNKNYLCIRGRQLLEEYCSSKNLDYKKIGKYVFSRSSSDLLDEIFINAVENGATGLRKCRTSDVKYLNQWCFAQYAFFSSNTGIIDSHGLAYSLLKDLQDNNGILSLASCVTDIEFDSKYCVRFVDGNGDDQIVTSERLVNCGGLSSIEVLDYLYKDHEMENYFIKGHYFSTRLSSPVPHLLYPMPEALGLGVHLTLDLNGRVKFGPDTYHVPDVNYRQEIDANVFFKKVVSNFKISGSESLSFDYAGIRPKVKIRGEVANDFIFLTEKDHKLNGMISLHGIDSPGLTSCLSIAEKVMSSL